MKLTVTQLKEGENAFDFASGKDPWVKALAQRIELQGTPLHGEVKAHVSLTKLEPDYFLKGEVIYSADQTCGRCAETFILPVTQTFEMALAHVNPKLRAAKPETLAEESEELDIQYFDGPDLDLAPLLEEQILLGLPYAPICKSDCKGICQTCGTNLNLEPCGCKAINPINAFAQLAQVRH